MNAFVTKNVNSKLGMSPEKYKRQKIKIKNQKTKNS